MTGEVKLSRTVRGIGQITVSIVLNNEKIFLGLNFFADVL